jgi:hypothetical protein
MFDACLPTFEAVVLQTARYPVLDLQTTLLVAVLVFAPFVAFTAGLQYRGYGDRPKLATLGLGVVTYGTLAVLGLVDVGINGRTVVDAGSVLFQGFGLLVFGDGRLSGAIVYFAAVFPALFVAPSARVAFRWVVSGRRYVAMTTAGYFVFALVTLVLAAGPIPLFAGVVALSGVLTGAVVLLEPRAAGRRGQAADRAPDAGAEREPGRGTEPRAETEPGSGAAAADGSRTDVAVATDATDAPDGRPADGASPGNGDRPGPRTASDAVGEDAGPSRDGEGAGRPDPAQDRPTHPPSHRIPRAPDIEVDYDALIEDGVVGSGGNADVRRVRQPTPDGEVTLAIKEPRMGGTLHTDAVDRLLSEAETWDKLDDHDHVVGVVDYGAQPLPWIAMEYMDGGHLGERMGALDTDQALWTAEAITRAVRHAHRRGVAHLDLKPSNVLFRSVEGAWDVPKVADWGLSKHLLEHSKSVEGLSPQYAAPEQFDDAYGATDDVTDVYQLGAVCYALFTGRPPFTGSPTAVMRAVLDERPTPPSELAAVPPGVDDVLLTALATEKADRYDSVVYLRDAFRDRSDGA